MTVRPVDVTGTGGKMLNSDVPQCCWDAANAYNERLRHDVDEIDLGWLGVKPCLVVWDGYQDPADGTPELEKIFVEIDGLAVNIAANLSKADCKTIMAGIVEMLRDCA